MKNVLILSSSHTASACIRQLTSFGGYSPGIYEKGAIKGTKYLVQAYKLGLKVK